MLRLFYSKWSIATWIETFVIRRTQQVVVNGATSSSTIVTSGVPQGTVIGSLLFLLYINDLPDNLSTSVRLFADYCICHNNIKALERIPRGGRKTNRKSHQHRKSKIAKTKCEKDQTCDKWEDAVRCRSYSG